MGSSYVLVVVPGSYRSVNDLKIHYGVRQCDVKKHRVFIPL